MNDLNIISTAESIEIKSSTNLVTIVIKSILNNIEKVKNKDIYMLKDKIPLTLFEIIENTILTMFNNDLTLVNLTKIKNLLSPNEFVKNVKKYLNKIIDNRVAVDVYYIRDNVPRNIYMLFLKEYVKDAYCWIDFSEHERLRRRIMNYSGLSSEAFELFVLMTSIPEIIADVFSNETYIVNVNTWNTIDDKNSNYCIYCKNKKNNIVKKNKIIWSTGDELLIRHYRNPLFWCSECLYEILFDVIEIDNQFFNNQRNFNYRKRTHTF